MPRAAPAAVPPDVRVRASAPVPLRVSGTEVVSTFVTFTGLPSGLEHVAVRLGDPGPRRVPLVRLHSECLTGDAFGSLRCDCGPQLHDGLEQVARRSGYLLYLRQEGRGIGLYNKVDAYALQDTGLDTFEANRALGRGDDERDYSEAAAMLTALGVDVLDLLTNNPDKVRQLRGLGVTVRRTVPTGTALTRHNLRYLRAKRDLAQHRIDLDAPVGAGHGPGPARPSPALGRVAGDAR